MSVQTPRKPAVTHRALLYASDEELQARMAVYILEGMRAGEQVLAIVTPDRIDAIRDRLPDHGAGVKFADAASWFLVPQRALAACDDYIQEQERRGRRPCVVCEANCDGRTQLHRWAWSRYAARLVPVELPGGGE